MILKHLSRTWLFIVLLLAALGSAACQREETPPVGASFTLAALEEMPAEVQSAPVAVQEAYRFAFANPEIMQQLPCYCGCGAMGHDSNYECYVSGAGVDGKPIFDNHAMGCSICVDITQDAMRLLPEGKSVAEIKTYVDATYSKFGPSNMP